MSEGMNKLFIREQHTTIGIRKRTKAKLDKNRAPGQCYDGFICQLVGLWEKTKEEEFALPAEKST